MAKTGKKDEIGLQISEVMIKAEIKNRKCEIRKHREKIKELEARLKNQKT
jgi:hypothetical protein